MHLVPVVKYKVRINSTGGTSCIFISYFEDLLACQVGGAVGDSVFVAVLV